MSKLKDGQLFFNSMILRIAGIKDFSIVDGQGCRFVIFTQGCKHHCDGCHNRHTWDVNGGYDVSVNAIVDRMRALPKDYTGITLSGGEPFEQEEACCFIAKKAHDFGLDVWTYTGYTFEQLNSRKTKDLLEVTDVLVDGPYVSSLKTDIPFIGSSNQRAINLRAVKNLNNNTLDNVKLSNYWIDTFCHIPHLA